MGQDERTDARRAWQLEDPCLRGRPDAVLPVEVAIADDRYVGRLANARDAAVRVATAQVVAEERQPPRAGRAERSQRLLERRVVAVNVGDQAPDFRSFRGGDPVRRHGDWHAKRTHTGLVANFESFEPYQRVHCHPEAAGP